MFAVRGPWVVRRLDLSAADLSFALRATLSSPPQGMAEQVERRFSPAGDALATLSVRSAFDLLLTAGDARGGDPPEVLFSALTVSDMPRIAREHGWQVSGLDLDPDTLAPRPGAITAAAGPRTRAVVLTHLFGGRADLAPLIAEARALGLMVVEDCAQAYAGAGWTGHTDAHVSTFSFGPIKTRTALGGALTRVRDGDLLARMRALHRAWPEQPASEYRRRVLKYAALHALSGPRAYGAARAAARLAGVDPDAMVHRLTRAFPGPEFFRRIRRRPAPALVALLGRRLAEDGAELEQRARRGARLRALLEGAVQVPGADMDPHLSWVFPVLVDEPRRLIAALGAAGFDATEGRSLEAVGSTPAAKELLRRTVYLPFRDDMPDEELARMAAVLRDAVVVRDAAAPRRG